MKLPKLTLPDYIRALGVPEFSQKYGVTQRATLEYLYAQRLPRPKVARRIVHDKSSPLTWDGIYGNA